jgi:hypothetical protein
MTHIYTCTGDEKYTKNFLKKYKNRKTNTYLIVQTHMDSETHHGYKKSKDMHGSCTCHSVSGYV